MKCNESVSSRDVTLLHHLGDCLSTTGMLFFIVFVCVNLACYKAAKKCQNHWNWKGVFVLLIQEMRVCEKYNLMILPLKLGQT